MNAAGDVLHEIGQAVLNIYAGDSIHVKYVVVWKQEDGVWKWDIDIWN